MELFYIRYIYCLSPPPPSRPPLLLSASALGRPHSYSILRHRSHGRRPHSYSLLRRRFFRLRPQRRRPHSRRYDAAALSAAVPGRHRFYPYFT